MSGRVRLISSQGKLLDELKFDITFIDIDICTAPLGQMKKVRMIFSPMAMLVTDKNILRSKDIFLLCFTSFCV